MASLNIDPNSMTIGDLDDFEQIVGKPMQEALAERPVIDPDTGEPQRDKRGRLVRKVQPSAKSMLALVYIARRKTDPGFTLEDARQVPISELTADEGEASEAPDPKE